MSAPLAVALTEALHDEYKARATYRAILARYGPVRPFTQILASEERHIQALLPLFARYQIPVPPDDWPTRITVPSSLAAACAAGVAGEIENGAMYTQLLAMTTAYPDVQQVFRRLQRASQQNHLPAFQRGVARFQRQSSVSAIPTVGGEDGRDRAIAGGAGRRQRHRGRHRGHGCGGAH